PVDNPPGNDPPPDPGTDPPDDESPTTDPADINTIAPNLASAAGGTVVTIFTGGFSDDFTVTPPTVTFGGVASTSVVAIDAVILTAEVPLIPEGSVDVQVVGSAFTGTATGFSIVAATAAGDIIVNEALPNPGGLDANRDGVQSNVDDEFVELVNLRTTPVDVSGHTLADATAVRHTFANPTTLPAGGSLVIFGTGNLAAASPGFMALHESGHALSASTGGLSLNNGGDTVTLATASGDVIDTATLGASVAGMSLNRTPDGDETAALQAHMDVTGSTADAATGGGFSPGLRVDQSAW
ncbi:MAG: lamin tail domain-containing protein, partial [Gammaproteobacteria bacterium]|nr:lamin tail domain-containing protein [Gammaproteobacteria bacterium]